MIAMIMAHCVYIYIMEVSSDVCAGMNGGEGVTGTQTPSFVFRFFFFFFFFCLLFNTCYFVREVGDIWIQGYPYPVDGKLKEKK